MFGFLNINKRTDCSSRWVVNQIQRLVAPARVGHAGTLDPLATGVLVVCVGPATRLAKYVQAMPKTYLAEFRLGVESDTEDCLGAVTPLDNANPISANQLSTVLPEFVGKILQRPPKFSALKIKGKRAYDLARQGKEVKLASRPIEVFEITLDHFDYPIFHLTIRCGSGTYIRSLGRDIGKRLGSGAIMTGLIRTAIGGFKIESGLSVENIGLEQVNNNLIPPQSGLPELARIEVPDEQAERFANGHTWMTETPMSDDEVLAVDRSGRLLAVLRQRSPGMFTPAVNFSRYWIENSPAN